MNTRWLNDPSIHFALIGALLFGLNYLFQDKNSVNSEEITVTENRIQHIASVFERGWQRPPRPDELQHLIDEFVREEVLYREAVRLGLDRDDTVIRRRMRMKMEYLAKDLVDAIEPAEPVLQDYYRQHSDKYTVPSSYSFEQIFLDSNKRAEVAEDARIVLTKLTAGADPGKLGDSNLLQRSYQNASAERIDRTFGANFSQQLVDLQEGQWAGPLTSAYGEHLVRISAQQPAHLPEFAKIRTSVLRDWQVDEQKQILETQYKTLRAKYRIHIAQPAVEVAGQ